MSRTVVHARRDVPGEFNQLGPNISSSPALPWIRHHRRRRCAAEEARAADEVMSGGGSVEAWNLLGTVHTSKELRP